MVLMCGLALLMTAFFAVLNSLSVKDNRKQKEAIGSFVGGLGVLPNGIMPEIGKKLLLKSAPLLDPGSDLADQGASLETIKEAMQRALGDKWQKIVTVKKATDGLTIQLSNQAFFEAGSSQLKKEKLNLLDQLSDIIAKAPCHVLIKGHTDDTPTTSANYQSNWELSAERAMNVLHYLLTKGCPLSRLEAAGFGEYDPLFPNDTPEHRAINRRVELQLFMQDKELPSSQSEDIKVHGFLFKIKEGLSSR